MSSGQEALKTMVSSFNFLMRVFGYDVRFSGLPPALAQRSDAAISDLKDPAEWLMARLGAASNATGITVTPLKALGVATVFACRRVLADTISTLPLEVHQVSGRDRRVAVEHPLHRVLGLKPNAEMTSANWREAVQGNLTLSAKGYSEILRDSDGMAVGVYPIESSRVDFWRDAQTKRLQYRLTDTGARLQPADVIHLRGNTFDGLNSLTTTTAVRDVIALALALQDNSAKFFGNGSRPGGVLEHPMSLSPEAQERLKGQFEEQTGGKNLYRLMVLEEGLKYNATRTSNKDSQFLESKDAQNLEICRVFGVPPHKVGISGNTPRANIEEENIGFITDIIRPICVKWEMELTTKLFTLEEQDQGFCTYLDLDALMRGNAEARYKSYSAGRQWSILSSNDCRAKENLPAVKGGDVLLQPINMIDAAKATEYLMKNNQQPSLSQSGAGGKDQNA